MKILVCISNVPDTTSKINFTEGDTKFDANGVQFVINPNDEFGLTRAMWFKEKVKKIGLHHYLKYWLVRLKNILRKHGHCMIVIWNRVTVKSFYPVPLQENIQQPLNNGVGNMRFPVESCLLILKPVLHDGITFMKAPLEKR